MNSKFVFIPPRQFSLSLYNPHRELGFNVESHEYNRSTDFYLIKHCFHPVLCVGPFVLDYKCLIVTQ